MPDALAAAIGLSSILLGFVLLYYLSVVDQRRRFFFSCLIYLFDGCDFRNKKYGRYSDFILFHFSTISSYCRIIEYEYQVHKWNSFSSTFGYLISFSRSFGVSKRDLLSFLKKYNMEAIYNEADLYES